MPNHDSIDYAKLLGFASVTGYISEGVDFQDEAISAKLGAKVGLEHLVACDLPLGCRRSEPTDMANSAA
jgi:hypothetical protein